MLQCWQVDIQGVRCELLSLQANGTILGAILVLHFSKAKVGYGVSNHWPELCSCSFLCKLFDVARVAWMYWKARFG